jgi:hypothetical protein
LQLCFFIQTSLLTLKEASPQKIKNVQFSVIFKSTNQSAVVTKDLKIGKPTFAVKRFVGEAPIFFGEFVEISAKSRDFRRTFSQRYKIRKTRTEETDVIKYYYFIYMHVANAKWHILLANTHTYICV